MPATLSACQQLPLHLRCGAENYTSLEVNYLDIANTMPVVAIWLADHPREMLPILSETAMCAGCPALGQAAWACHPAAFSLILSSHRST